MTDMKDISKLFKILESDKDSLIQPLDSRIPLTNITPTPRKEKYNDFFRELFREFFDPLCHQDFSVNGIRCLLFIPEARIYPNSKDIKFYVKSSFEKAEHHLTLFPSYLPFVKAVINSETPIKESLYPTLRETMVKKTVAMLQDLCSREGCSLDDKLNYSLCWINFGEYLKMGCIERTDYQSLMVPLLRFTSSKSLLEDEIVSLDKYVESMHQNQKQVYYLTVKSFEIAKGSPYLATHIEVIILYDIHDKLLVEQLGSYKGYQFCDITKADLSEFSKGLSAATFGITDNLRVFVNGLTPATFQANPEQDELEVSDLKTTAKDLSEWQKGHVTLVLGSIRQVSILRYALCPDVMKERRFWKIYFTLVNTHLAPYVRKYMEELRSKAESSEDEEAKKTQAVVGTETTVKNVAKSRTSTASSEQDDDSDEAPDVDFGKIGKKETNAAN